MCKHMVTNKQKYQLATGGTRVAARPFGFGLRWKVILKKNCLHGIMCSVIQTQHHGWVIKTHFHDLFHYQNSELVSY